MTPTRRRNCSTTAAPIRWPASSRRWIGRSSAATGRSPATPPRQGCSAIRSIYDVDWEEGEKIAAWRRAAAAARSEPPLLAAAMLWDAWEQTRRSSARPGSETCSSRRRCAR